MSHEYSGPAGLLGATIIAAVALATPASASTYFEEEVTCPVGGETFTYMALAAISQWGAMPDGMPIGSGAFPTELPQCPSNKLVMYRDFQPEEVTALADYIAGPEYRALIEAGETPYYLAYRTAQVLGDDDSVGLLLSASWQAKNADPAGARSRRYNEEFVRAIEALPAEASSIESIAKRARAANALRELGRFEEAEDARAAIVIAPEAGGDDPDAAANREGWGQFLVDLQGPIARHDDARLPIDLMGTQEASYRCLAKEFAEAFERPSPPPLSAFEAEYCTRPELAEQLQKDRDWLHDQG